MGIRPIVDERTPNGKVGDGKFEAYVRQKLLGLGGQGDVWEVERNGIRYAMKVPKERLPYDGEDQDLTRGGSKSAIENFTMELENWADVTDNAPDAVVRLVDLNIDPYPWAVMELAETDMRHWMYESKIGPAEIADLLDKLQKVHEAGIFHRDLKPENILLVNGTWKLSDFGISRSKTFQYSSTNSAKGTSYYMAPEQISKKRFGPPNERTDIWEMGIILYEVLMGKSPYEDCDSLETTIIMDGPDISDAPPQYLPVLEKALAQDKKDRFVSASDFADALRMAINGKNTLIDSKPSYKGPDAVLKEEKTTVKEKANEPGPLNGKEEAQKQYELGNAYYYGRDVPQSYVKARKCYLKAAEQGNDEAQNSLGRMYEDGLGVLQSYETAVEWYQKAAEQGNDEAQNSLGRMYVSGNGVGQSYEKAAEWYNKSAVQGNADAQNSLGRLYAEGLGVERSYDKAFEWRQRSADQGNADAQNSLGRMYEDGLGVLQSYETAVEWYQKAAEQGNADAQNNLGMMYERGNGVKQSYEKAVEWYTKAADQGNADAQNNLGMMYERGNGVKQSYEKAVEWYTKAAVQGNIQAKNKISHINELMAAEKDKSNTVPMPQSLFDQIMEAFSALDPNSVPLSTSSDAPQRNSEAGGKDSTEDTDYLCLLGEALYYGKAYKDAFENYLKAANLGNAVAQFYLGLMYEKGRGVEQSDKKAVEWYTNAAEQGNAAAQCNLGLMYKKGRGVEQSDKKAVEWITKAAEQGDAEAQKELVRLNKELFKTPNESKMMNGSLTHIKEQENEPFNKTVENDYNNVEDVHSQSGTKSPSEGMTGDCFWRLIGTELTIFGPGVMGNYSVYDPSPWGTDITKIILEKSVVSIGDCAFNGCTRLTSVVIAESVKSICNESFADCVSLTSIHIPDAVKTIGYSAFRNCKSLSTIVFGKSVKTIGYSAFRGCISLKSLALPEHVSFVGKNAFHGCPLLTVATIPNNLDIHSVFDDGVRIDRMPKNVACADITIKQSCGNQHGDNNSEKSGTITGTSGSCSWTLAGTELTITGSGPMGEYDWGLSPWGINITKVTINDGVTEIGECAFSGCSSLKSVSLPNSIVSIGRWAFSGCSSLKSLTLTDSIFAINEYSFSGCSSLSSIIFPDSLRSIGHGAFSDCNSLESVTIPRSVRFLDSSFGKNTKVKKKGWRLR